MKHTEPRTRKILWLGLVGILLLVALTLFACTPKPTPTLAPTAVIVDVNQLYASPWTLVEYGDPANPTVVSTGLKITLDVTADGQLSGFSGCNTYSATVQVTSDGSMTVGPLATTLMACEQGMNEESAYLSALQTARSFNFNTAGRLEIKYSAEGEPDQVLVYAVGEKPLAGTNWTLLSYGDPSAPVKVPPEIVITAIFSEDGMVSGFSGCNQYSASYTVQDGKLMFGPVAATQMMCSPEIMEAEQTYYAALGVTQQYTISGQFLSIVYNNGLGTLTFTSASLPLEHTLWTLAQINGQPVATETAITAIFTPGEIPDSGVVSGFSGCNTYNAGYTLDGTNLAIQPAATTMMACPTGMDTEMTYIQALQTSTSYQVIVDRLILTNPTGSLTYVANRTPLSGALWTLVSLGDVENPELPVEGSLFNAQFSGNLNSPSGVLTGTTGCNEYSTAYTASLTEIKINEPLGTNNTSCAPGLADQEKLYFLALNDATTYQILGNTLTIPYDDGKQALVFEGTQLEVANRPPLSDLNGTTWYLWYINSSPVISGSSIRADIVVNADGKSGTITGSAGCNNYLATFGNNLGVEATLTANQVCSQPADIMSQEQTYIDMLSHAYGYWQNGDQFILNTGKGVLTYRNSLPPSASDQTHLLVDRNWYLVAYKNTYSLPGTQEPYILFSANGTLTGYTGCNAFQGNYSTNIQQMTITNLNSQKAACPTSALQSQEDAVLEILGTVKSYQVVETVMQLFADSGVLNYSLTPMNRPEEIVPPQAVIKAPTTGQVSQVISFDGTASTGSQSPIANWEWNFGDGTTGAGPFSNHVYEVPGVYNVQLLVTDQRGYQDTETMSINISAATVSTPTPTSTPTQLPGPTQTPVPTLPAAPTQMPTPTQAALPTLPPSVPPQAVLKAPGNGYVGEPVIFDASASVIGSSPIVSYSWNFGDGTTAGPDGNPSQTKIFNQAGTFQVSVIVTDQNGQSSEAIQQVVISTRMGTPVVWILNSFAGDSVLPGTTITLQFQNGQIAGFGGCNSYTGGYTSTDNGDGTYGVTITGLTSTSSACPEDIMKQESYYLSALQSITTAQMQGNTLILSFPSGVLPDGRPYPADSLNYQEAGTY